MADEGLRPENRTDFFCQQVIITIIMTINAIIMFITIRITLLS